MTLWVLGLNHQTAPVELRERAAFGGDALSRAMASLRETPQLAEGKLLSTCNRTELYAVAEDAHALTGWLALTPAISTATSTSTATTPPCATCSASPPDWIQWCWASRKFSAR